MSGQLESLTAYLMALTPVRIHGSFMAETAGVQLVRSTRRVSEGQQRIGVARSTVELSWYAYPYREYSPAMIYALVLAWIEGHANDLFDELNLPEPSADISLDTEQQGRGDVTITLELADELILWLDEQGEIELSGERWSLATPEVWTAETFEVDTRIKSDADAAD